MAALHCNAKTFAANWRAALVAFFNYRANTRGEVADQRRIATQLALAFQADLRGRSLAMEAQADEAHVLGEQTNFAFTQLDRARAMHQMLVTWRQQVGAQMPAPKSKN